MKEKLTKRTFAFFIAMVMLIGSIPIIGASAAYGGKCGANARWQLDNSGTLTISGTGDMYDYGYDREKQKSIDAPWHNYTYIKTVEIKEGITHIGEYAFEECKNVSRVVIPNSVKTIGSSAFAYCEKLSDVVIPNSVEEISGNAFECCKALKSVTIPESVNTIGPWAFTSCTNLESITLPNHPIAIWQEVFSYTAYYNDESNWKDDVLYVGNHLVKAQETISGKYKILNGTKSIAAQAFLHCVDLTEVTIPEGITEMMFGTFGFCEKLEKVILPKSISKMSQPSFYGCTNLSEITILNPDCEIWDHENEFDPEMETIIGFPGSTAEQYAKKYGKTFVALDEGSYSCSHICHKGGIVKLLYKILLIFYKLLGINQVCSCGAYHY